MCPFAPPSFIPASGRLSGLTNWYQQNRFLVLLVMLTILLCLHPLAETRSDLGKLFGLGVAVMLLLQILTLAQTQREKWIGIALAIPEIVLTILKYQFITTPLALPLTEGAAIMFIPFHTYAIWVIYRYLFNQPRVTVDEVRGAICVYMLIGATWSAFYYTWELFVPGSWAMSHSHGHSLTWFDLIYFSFATLGSLGLGDISPVHPIARSLTILESITGLFFVAITVARLVTQFMNHEQAAQSTLPQQRAHDMQEDAKDYC